MELYDLFTDPGEQVNVAADRKGRVNKMTEVVEACLATLPSSYNKSQGDED